MYTISKPKVAALKVLSTKMLTSSFLLMLESLHRFILAVRCAHY